MNFNGGFQNPYFPANQYAQQYGMMGQQPQQMPQQMQVTRVNGENGARAFQIGANSSALLLDESGTLVWLVTTDGAGYKTVAPYDIQPHQATPTPDYTNLEARIARLEGMINDTTNSSAVGKGKPISAERAEHKEYDRNVQRKPASYDPECDE